MRKSGFLSLLYSNWGGGQNEVFDLYLLLNDFFCTERIDIAVHEKPQCIVQFAFNKVYLINFLLILEYDYHELI